MRRDSYRLNRIQAKSTDGLAGMAPRLHIPIFTVMREALRADLALSALAGIAIQVSDDQPQAIQRSPSDFLKVLG